MGAPTLPWNVDSIINFQGLLLFLGFAVEEGGGFKCEYVKLWDLRELDVG